MRTARVARSIWQKMKLPCLSEVITNNLWKAVGWTGDRRQNAVLQSLDYVCAWRSTVWWRNIKALNMLVGPTKSREMEAYMGGDTKEVASGIRKPRKGQGLKTGGIKDRKCLNATDKKDLVTFALVNVKHSVGHAQTTKMEKLSNQAKKRVENIGPA